MIDPESVRVDLLKFRQKAFLSYPEGSLERKKFLKTILQNELMLSKQDMPESMVNFLMEGKRVVFWSTIEKASLWFGAACLSAMAFVFTTNYAPFSFLFLFLSGFFLFRTTEHIREYFKYKKHVKVVEQYSNDMKLYMNKLSNDIRRLEGPRGF